MKPIVGYQFALFNNLLFFLINTAAERLFGKPFEIFGIKLKNQRARPLFCINLPEEQKDQ
ncbi:MAG: hypothetical protein R2825_21010 [Saprospiraceae bacterium]